jgi:hypothetical protein
LDKFKTSLHVGNATTRTAGGVLRYVCIACNYLLV